MRPIGQEVYRQVLAFIEDLERHHKDTSGGYELGMLLGENIRRMSVEDREAVVETLFYQFENGMRYGYLLADVVREIRKPEYIERFVGSMLTAAHIGIPEYEVLLRDILGYEHDEIAGELLTTLQRVVRDLVGQGKAEGAVLLAVLVRVGVPFFVREAGRYIGEWVRNSSKPDVIRLIDATLLSFGDFLDRDGIELFLQVLDYMGTPLDRKNSIDVFRERITSNPLLAVSCKYLKYVLDRTIMPATQV